MCRSLHRKGWSVLATDKGSILYFYLRVNCLSFLSQSFIISRTEVIIYIYNYYDNMITVLNSHIRDIDIIVVDGWASPLSYPHLSLTKVADTWIASAMIRKSNSAKYNLITSNIFWSYLIVTYFYWYILFFIGLNICHNINSHNYNCYCKKYNILLLLEQYHSALQFVLINFCLTQLMILCMPNYINAWFLC